MLNVCELLKNIRMLFKVSVVPSVRIFLRVNKWMLTYTCQKYLIWTEILYKRQKPMAIKVGNLILTQLSYASFLWVTFRIYFCKIFDHYFTMLSLLNLILDKSLDLSLSLYFRCLINLTVETLSSRFTILLLQL